MVQDYQVRLVGKQEWEKVVHSDTRYQHVNKDNLGFADTKHHTAYVRNTYWPLLNRYLIKHEFEHLVEGFCLLDSLIGVDVIVATAERSL